MCEVSLENVTGEWYKDGHRIRPTSTIKIRTEGQTRKRFLMSTICLITLLSDKLRNSSIL